MADMPEPSASSGELIVRVKACAINYPDALLIQDRYQFRPTRPFAPGCEVAGVVESVGAEVSGWQAGDRVIGFTTYGGLAQKIALPAPCVFRLPDRFSFVEGAALILAYATSLHALVDRGEIKAGESLLVLGATGGVGLAAVQLGVALGARVVAAVSSHDKAAAALAAGAHDALIYQHSPFRGDQSRRLAEQFKAALGHHGADVIFDPVGGEYTEPALRAIARGGRYLIVGFTAGIPKLPLNLPLLKSCDLRGVAWGPFAERDPGANRRHVATLFELWSNGKITPKVTAVWALAEGANAIAALMARKVIGKLVVTVD